MKYSIKAKSSSGGFYDITVDVADSVLRIFCTCDAGKKGKLCRHKTAILNGDREILLEIEDAGTLDKINSIVKISEYPLLLEKHDNLKCQIEELKKKEKQLRDIIEAAMRNGIQITGGINS